MTLTRDILGLQIQAVPKFRYGLGLGLQNLVRPLIYLECFMISTSKRRFSKIAIKQLALRKTLWPELDEKLLWLRIERDGFTTIPRSFPIMLQIMDSLSKGKPVSSTYFELWCRAYDECFIVLNKPQELAFHSGFSGQRAQVTWKDRIRALAELGFIDVKPGPSGEMSYALIYNPYHIIKMHHKNKHSGITTDLYNALAARAIEIGANDLS